MHTMTDNILEWRKVEYVIEGLTRWLGQTGLPDDMARLAVEELAEKFGLDEVMIAEILAVLE